MNANTVVVLIIYVSGMGLIYHLAKRGCEVDAVYAIIIAVLKVIGLL